MKRTLLAAVLLLCGTSSVRALPIIIAGDHPLLPNTSGQRVDVYVSGGDLIQGMNVFAEIGNSNSPPGTVQTAPKFDGIQYNGIFAGGNEGQTDYTPNHQFIASFVVTQGGPPDENGIIAPEYVAASGLLFSVFVDTSGYFSGVYPFTLANTTLQVSTQLVQNDVIPSEIHNGTISIVPEPPALTLLAIALVSVCVALLKSLRLPRETATAAA